MKKPRLQFLLEDILDIKYGEDRRSNRKLAAHLVKNIRGVRMVQPLNGFALGGTLLVIRDAQVPAIKNLVLLDSCTSTHLRIENLKNVAKRFQ